MLTEMHFNVKLDSKYQSLLTPANNSPKFKGGIHVEVVCQGPNTSIDPIKVNQCKDPKYDGPRFKLPPVGTRVQVTGRYLIDVNEGGHSEIHPAYEVIINPTSPPPPPTPLPPPTGTCQKLQTSNVAASGSETGNLPSNAIDNNLNTRWSNLGVGSWIQADLGGGQMTICSVDIAWYNGNQRQNNFVVSVSNDGSTFTKVPFTGKSTGTTLSPERYNLPANTVGRFVRIIVNGNTQNNWASITEIAVNGFAGTTSHPPSTPFNLPVS
jgi:F5/8 type C domain